MTREISDIDAFPRRAQHPLLIRVLDSLWLDATVAVAARVTLTLLIDIVDCWFALTKDVVGGPARSQWWLYLERLGLLIRCELFLTLL